MMIKTNKGDVDSDTIYSYKNFRGGTIAIAYSGKRYFISDYCADAVANFCCAKEYEKLSLDEYQEIEDKKCARERRRNIAWAKRLLKSIDLY